MFPVAASHQRHGIRRFNGDGASCTRRCSRMQQNAAESCDAFVSQPDPPSLSALGMPTCRPRWGWKKRRGGCLRAGLGHAGEFLATRTAYYVEEASGLEAATGVLDGSRRPLPNFNSKTPWRDVDPLQATSSASAAAAACLARVLIGTGRVHIYSDPMLQQVPQRSPDAESAVWVMLRRRRGAENTELKKYPCQKKTHPRKDAVNRQRLRRIGRSLGLTA
jgi:hypothetical protein